MVRTNFMSMITTSNYTITPNMKSVGTEIEMRWLNRKKSETFITENPKDPNTLAFKPILSSLDILHV